MSKDHSTEEILTELESLFSHMFSREVIESDSFMQSVMTSAMTLPISVILESPRVQSVTTDRDLILQALSSSHSVVVVEDHVRPNYKIEQNTIIVRDLENISEESLKALFFENGCPAVTSCRSDMNSSWFLSFRNEDDAREALLKIRGAKFNGQPVRARLKTESMAKSFYMPSRSRNMHVNTNFNSGMQGYSFPSPMQQQNPQHMRASPVASQIPSPLYRPAYPGMYQPGFAGGQYMYMQQQQQLPPHMFYAVGPDGRVWPAVHPAFGSSTMPPNLISPVSVGNQKAGGGGKRGKLGGRGGSFEGEDDRSRQSRQVDGVPLASSSAPAGLEEGEGLHATADDKLADSQASHDGRDNKAKKKVSKPKKKDTKATPDGITEHTTGKRGPTTVSAADSRATPGAKDSFSNKKSADNKAGAAKGKALKQAPEFNLEADFPSLVDVPSVKPHSPPLKNVGSTLRSWARAVCEPSSVLLDSDGPLALHSVVEPQGNSNAIEGVTLSGSEVSSAQQQLSRATVTVAEVHHADPHISYTDNTIYYEKEKPLYTEIRPPTPMPLQDSSKALVEADLSLSVDDRDVVEERHVPSASVTDVLVKTPVTVTQSDPPEAQKKTAAVPAGYKPTFLDIARQGRT